MPAIHLQRKIVFGDCDPAGVIYTPRAADFAVEAAHEFLTVLFGEPGVRKVLAMGVLPPGRALNIEYLSFLRYDDVIDMEITAEAGATSFTTQVIARKPDGTVCFKARLTQVCISPDTMRPVPLPELLRTTLAKGAA